jgi:type II secretory pathway pseudopilin PulG
VHRGDEEGFTLIELVIVIVILPMVVGGIAAALIAILQTESTTFNKVGDSADAQITSVNFTRDVQSANAVTDYPATAGQCWPTASSDWPATPPANAVPILGLTWSETISRTINDGMVRNDDDLFSSTGEADFTNADVGSVVSDPPPNGQNLIPSSTTSPTGITTIENILGPDEVQMTASAKGYWSNDVVTITLTKRWLASYWDVPVTSGSTTKYELVRQFCESAGGPANFLSSSIVAHDLPATAAQGIATITRNSTVPASQCVASPNWIYTTCVTSIALSANEPGSGYQFDLSATPRNSSSNSEGVSGLLLTGSGPNPGLNELAGDSLTVNGDLDFTSTTGTAVGSADSSLAVNPIPGQSPIAANQCGTSCGYVTQGFQGSLACSGSPSCPSNGSLGGPGVPLPAPPPIQAPVGPISTGPAGACSGTGPTTCSPGYYTSLPALTGTVLFTPGNYTFAGTVTVGTGTTFKFDSGQYTFDAGLTLSPFAELLTPNNNGDFFYFAGTGSLNANAFEDTVQLSALTTGPYAGILIDQPSSDSSGLTFGGGNTTNTLDGVVDAPAAQVSLGSSNDKFTMGNLIASSVILGSDATVKVGSA